MSIIQAERPQFYEGQYLGAEDLAALLEYLRAQNRRHHLAGHSWGIATGLQLKEMEAQGGGGEMDVFIQPGLAWDGFGRPIVLTAPYKLSVEKFQGEPDGLVKVWLQYSQEDSAAPRAGFSVCDTQEQFARIAESFTIAVGERSHLQQHDTVTIAGVDVDALEAFYALDESDELICDESIAFQTFPEDDNKAQWLIPLGYVNWLAASNQFGELSDGQDKKRSRSARIYCGIVTEQIHAADGVIRLRSRGTEAPVTGSLSAVCDEQKLLWSDAEHLDITEQGQATDLIWLEGRTRALGDIKLFDSKLDFRNVSGLTDDVPLWLQRVESNLLGGKDLQFIIGQDEDGLNRLTIGPKGAGDEDPIIPRVTVLDSGEVGVGIEQPKTLTHLFSSSDPTLKMELDGNSGPSGRLSFRQNMDSGADIVYDDSAASAGLVVETITAGIAASRLIIKNSGNIGVATLSPEHLLQIGDANAPVSMSLRGPDGESESSVLAFEDDDGTNSRWFKLIHDTDVNTLKVSSANIDPIMSFARTTGRVGIGTTTPAYALDIRSSVNNGFSVGKGGDAGRIWTEYLNFGPAMIFYDMDDVGGSLRFRESPNSNDENNPEYEAVISGKRGNIGIGTTEPNAELDVRGDIKLGNSGELYATSSVENLRLIVGRVNSTGNKVNGDGYNSNRTDTGKYTITFPAAFASTPVVTVTLVNSAGEDHVATLKVLSNNSFEVWITDVENNENITGVLQNSEFCFMAVGSR